MDRGTTEKKQQTDKKYKEDLRRAAVSAQWTTIGNNTADHRSRKRGRKMNWSRGSINR